MKRVLEILFGIEPGQWVGADSWRIALDGAPAGGWGTLALAGVAAAMVWWIARNYRRELDVPPRAKAMLAGLRVLIVLLILLLALAPTIVLRHVRFQSSTVAVLVDDSLSMSLADADGQASRAEIVRDLVGRAGGPVERLAAEYDIELSAFGSTRPGLAGYVRRLGTWPCDGGPGMSEQLSRTLEPIVGSGFRTDLAGAVRQTLNQMRPSRLAAVVLLSDGRSADAGGDVAARLKGVSDLLADRRVKLFTVCVGDPAVRANIRTASLAMPADVRAGAEVEARVTIDSVGCQDRSAVVNLLRRSVGGDAWVDTGRSVAVTLKAGSTVATIPVVCDQVGEYLFKAVTTSAGDDLLADDNEAVACVSVREGKTRVLLVSGDAGWEFQYLRNFLQRADDRYQVAVWLQNADVRFTQDGTSASPPKSLGELVDRFDVVVLYDPARTAGGFDSAMAGMLKEFVGSHRGGLCYIASNKHTAANLTSEAFADLADVLPVEISPDRAGVAERIGRDIRAGWPVRPVGGGEHPVLRLDGDGERNEQLWRDLPGVFWTHPVRKLKPAAVALAVSADPAGRTDAGEPVPAIAVQMYGRGPVLYMGFDATWRWRFVGEGRAYRRFWSNVIDHLGAYRMSKRRTILTTAGDAFAVGDSVRITAEAYDEAYRPLSASNYPVRLVDIDGGAERVIDLPAVHDGGGRYRKTVRLDQAGRFEVAAVDDVPADQVATAVFAVRQPRAEFAHPEADPATLRTLAGEKNALAIEQFDQLPERLGPGRRRVVRQTVCELANIPLAMVLLTTLLMLEWIGRKKYNMT